MICGYNLLFVPSLSCRVVDPLRSSLDQPSEALEFSARTAGHGSDGFGTKKLYQFDQAFNWFSAFCMIHRFATNTRFSKPVSRTIFSISMSTSDVNQTMPSQEECMCSSSVKATPEIEKNFVHRVYDAIAPHFSSTRFAKWPKVAGFLNSIETGSIILDAGCGNGKYLGLNPDCFYIGCDISPSLIEICGNRGHEVLVADALNLPYRDNFGDAAISIAVLHHLSTEIRRRKAIEELVRVVKKGGLVLITVWAVEQEDESLLAKWTPLFTKYDDEWVDPDPSTNPTRNQSSVHLARIPETETVLRELEDENKVLNGEVSSGIGEGSNSKQQEYFVPWHLPYHRAEVSGASAVAVEHGFAKKDDKKGAVVYNRYYHVFAEGELQRLVSGMKNATIVNQFYDKSNWCIVLKKM